MDESLKTGVGLTGFVCAAGYILGGITALFPCIIFCGIIWLYEVKERITRPPFQVKKCEHCGCKVRITDKKTEWKYKTIRMCPLCIDKMFKYSMVRKVRY